MVNISTRCMTGGALALVTLWILVSTREVFDFSSSARTLYSSWDTTEQRHDQYRRALRHAKNGEVTLQEDGTLYITRNARQSPCDIWKDRELRKKILRVHYHFDDCYEVQLGNRLGEHYGRYMFAKSAGLAYKMTCGNTSVDPTVLKHLNSTDPQFVAKAATRQLLDHQVLMPQSEFVGESVLKALEVKYKDSREIPLLRDVIVDDVCYVCSRLSWHCKQGPEWMSEIIRKDMRKLAYNTTTGQSLDGNDADAVIHLRLGDALNGVRDEFIGVLPHQTYVDILKEVEREQETTIETIDIVTQPFAKSTARWVDKNTQLLHRSELITLDLVRYLQAAFPASAIKIQNDRTEVPMKSFARLTRAKKVSVCGSSTFCTDAVLGTNNGAIGYLMKTEKHNSWSSRAVPFYDNLRSFRAPRLANHFIEQLRDEDLLHWLSNQLPTVDVVSIGERPLIRNS